MNRQLKFSGILLVTLIVAQLVPYGRDHTNPATTKEPAWDLPETRLLAKQACFDCHSDETVWPWYSNIAPVSWLTQYDVDAGRATLNFSEWDIILKNDRYRQILYDQLDQVIIGNEMPPFNYLLLHPEAVLAQHERDQLLNGLKEILKAP